MCLSGIPADDMEYGKEVTLYHTGFTAALLEVGVSAQVFSFDLEESLRQKAVRDRAAYDAAMARLTADGHDAAKFGQLADAFFRRAKGRAPTEAERPGATAEFAAKLGAARAKKAAAGATVATKADKPEFFWGDDVIGLWDDGGSWFWDDWEISIERLVRHHAQVRAVPLLRRAAGAGPRGLLPERPGQGRGAHPRHRPGRCLRTRASVGTPTLESGFGAIDIEFSANAGVTAEAIEVMAAGVEGKISTECDTSSCSYPDMEICAFAELKFPDFELPSWDICGNEIGFDFDLPSLGVEALGRATAPPARAEKAEAPPRRLCAPLASFLGRTSQLCRLRACERALSRGVVRGAKICRITPGIGSKGSKRRWQRLDAEARGAIEPHSDQSPANAAFERPQTRFVSPFLTQKHLLPSLPSGSNWLNTLGASPGRSRRRTADVVAQPAASSGGVTPTVCSRAVSCPRARTAMPRR